MDANRTNGNVAPEMTYGAKNVNMSQQLNNMMPNEAHAMTQGTVYGVEMVQNNRQVPQQTTRRSKTPIIVGGLLYVITVAAFIVAIIFISGKKTDKYNELVKKYNALGEEYNTLCEKYDGVASKYQEMSTNYESVNSQYEQLLSDYNTLSDDYGVLYDDYATLYDETTVTYEKPENLDEYDSTVTYDNLARTPDEYEGKAVKMSGKVVQVVEGDGETDLRIAINNNYDQIVYVVYNSAITDQRVLEDDRVTFYGVSYGLYTYQSTLGGNITVPLLLVDYIEIN